MKRLILAVLIVGAVGGGIWGTLRRNSVPIAPALLPEESAPAETTINTEVETIAPPQPTLAQTISTPSEAQHAIERSTAATIDPAAAEAALLRQAIDLLVSPQTSLEEKYTTWIKLRDEGKLDQVIAELNQRATNNPTAAEFPAALGQAYLHKISATKDTRDYALLGVMADRSFDTALEIDPANWDARFFKTMAMSYWPEEMNKRADVIQRFNQLMQDQETQTPQPQFAQTYVWLGDQYQKSGRPDYAQQIWQRGAALFPSEPTLKQKLSAQP